MSCCGYATPSTVNKKRKCRLFMSAGMAAVLPFVVVVGVQIRDWHYGLGIKSSRSWNSKLAFSCFSQFCAACELQ